MSEYTRRGQNQLADEFEAVRQLAQEIGHDSMAGVIFFCSSHYDLDRIAQGINQHFTCPVLGCTTAGEVSAQYQVDGIVGVSFHQEKFAFHTATIADEKAFDASSATELIQKLTDQLSFSSQLDPSSMFGFLLNPGLVSQEEKVASLIAHELKGVGLFGGTAGDDYAFKYAPVFTGKGFEPGAGALAIIETKLDFQLCKIQHYTGSDKDMVVTKADSAERIVYQINGAPAAEELASIIGIEKSELAMKVYSTNPLMLQVGNEWYVRSIQQVFEDGSISFACAIDEGLPLTVGKITGLLPSLRTEVARLTREFSSIELTIGCECVHRRLEIEEIGITREVEETLGPLSFFGFATYGEQYNALHVNQTLTCVVIGER